MNGSSRTELALRRLDQLAVESGLRELLAGERAWFVGGVVRDALLGLGLDGIDIDVAISIEPAQLLAGSGLELTVHERFGTATVEVGGRRVDLARTRTEQYTEPGALPEVEPAPLEEDLGRRDFSINAIAVAVGGAEGLIDPFDGSRDLYESRLRLLHEDSLADDPTRALRAARYAARLGLEPDEATRSQLTGVDLDSISAQRRDRELSLIAAEPDAAVAARLVAEWGVLSYDEQDLALASALAGVRRRPPWAGLGGGEEAMAGLLVGDLELRERAETLAAVEPGGAAVGTRLAERESEAVVTLARALGAEWLERWAAEWRRVKPSISGTDLIAAGVEQGPQVGRLLAGVRDALLEGELEPGRESELEHALASL